MLSYGTDVDVTTNLNYRLLQVPVKRPLSTIRSRGLFILPLKASVLSLYGPAYAGIQYLNLT